MLLDGLMQGKVHHVRLHPKRHNFTYASSMLLLDVCEFENKTGENIFRKSKLWSFNRPNVVSVFRKDYIGGKKQNFVSIHEEVKQLIYERTGRELTGKVKILTQPRQWGFVFNPVSFYFCYNDKEQLEWIISEINNTPWNERHAYLHNVKDMQSNNNGDYQFLFDKCFHVSPFMPMNLKYEWKFILKGQDLNIFMKLFKKDELQFTASLNLEWHSFKSRNMNLMPFKFPLQTFLIVYRIYWNAFLLYLKKVPFYTHPNKLQEDLLLPTESNHSERS